MNTRLRAVLSFVKSHMTCFAILVLSVCGLFIPLRPAP